MVVSHVGSAVRTIDSRLAKPSTKDDYGRQTLHVSFEGVVTDTIDDDSLGTGGRVDEMRFLDNLTQYNNGDGTTCKVG